MKKKIVLWGGVKFYFLKKHPPNCLWPPWPGAKNHEMERQKTSIRGLFCVITYGDNTCIYRNFTENTILMSVGRYNYFWRSTTNKCMFLGQVEVTGEPPATPKAPEQGKYCFLIILGKRRKFRNDWDILKIFSFLGSPHGSMMVMDPGRPQKHSNLYIFSISIDRVMI